MIKRAIKSALASVVYYTGLLSLIRKSPRRRSSAIVLMYHRVLPAQPVDVAPDHWEHIRSLPGIVVTPDVFDGQLTFLARHYNVISLGQLLQHLDSGSLLPPRTVVITFDDGWRDNYTYAFPLLKKHNLPATVFLTAGYIGTLNVFWPEQVIWYLSNVDDPTVASADDLKDYAHPLVAELLRSSAAAAGTKRMKVVERLINATKELPPAARAGVLAECERISSRGGRQRKPVRVVLDWGEIAEMQAGGISFGSHGASHELLTLIDRVQQEQELLGSRRLLESRLGTAVDALAYPNGAFDGELKRLAAQSGYACAVSVRRSRVSSSSDRYALGRVNVHQGCSRGMAGAFSEAVFACHIEGIEADVSDRHRW
jgi:peptidoglycan/xylan/chitin deacetylase (PgdA/CDA1 family)